MSKSKTQHSKAENQNESKSYQAMLEQVEHIVRNVNSGSLDLDQVVANVEEGYGLIKQMRERLDTTKSKIEHLRTEFEKDSTQASGKTGSEKTMHQPPGKAKTTESPAQDSSDDEDDDDSPF